MVKNGIILSFARIEREISLKYIKICENHDYCNVEIPTKDNNIIKCDQGEKSIKLPFVVYTDLEFLLVKMSTCENNPNESSTTEIN